MASARSRRRSSQSKARTWWSSAIALKKLKAVADEVGTEPLTADFTEFEQVRRLAGEINDRVDHIDVLVNNAGGMFLHGNTTPDGHEPNFQINHLSPFL